MDAEAGVCGAPQGHLSSYSFTLMAIYFMQTCHGLPCLPTDAFSEDGPAPNVRNLRWESALPVPTLLMQFCLFYHHEFQWGTEVVSPRMGCRMTIREQCFSWLETWGESRLHIEDPFILERNLNCVLGSWQEGSTVLVYSLNMAKETTCLWLWLKACSSMFKF